MKVISKMFDIQIPEIPNIEYYVFNHNTIMDYDILRESFYLALEQNIIITGNMELQRYAVDGEKIIGGLWTAKNGSQTFVEDSKYENLIKFKLPQNTKIEINN